MNGVGELGGHQLFAGAVQLLVLWLAVSVHESSHAWVARKYGDSTAADQGRISLNPLKHLDLVGTIFVPVLLLFASGPIFGWGKPAPVRVGSLDSPDADHVRVTLAGPLANLLVGLGSLWVLAILLLALGPEASQTATMSLMRDLEGASEGQNFPILYTLVQMAFLNGFLGVLNMIPIPPLDGGQLALQLLPRKWAIKYSVIRPYGFMIVLLLAVLNVLSIIVLPVYLVIALVIQASG